VKEKSTHARSAKQIRKDNLRLALAAIKHKVPKEGRGIFKGGNEMNDSDIEPLDDHDALVKKASKKIIRIDFAELPSAND
jgi:predicted nucleotidyltransferase